MGAMISKFLRPAPWKRLRAPARISLVGQQESDPHRMLYYIVPTPEEVVVEIPKIGLDLWKVQRPPLSILSQMLGGSCHPLHAEEMKKCAREYADAFIYTIDCANRNVWEEAKWELGDFVLDLSIESRRSPLLVLADNWDTPGAMTIQEIEQAVRKALEVRGQLLLRPFAIQPFSSKLPVEYDKPLSWIVDAINTQRETIVEKV